MPALDDVSKFVRRTPRGEIRSQLEVALLAARVQPEAIQHLLAIVRHTLAPQP